MKKTIIAAAMALLVGACQPQSPQSVESVPLTPLQKSALSSDLAYEIVESLTTEVGPRLPGTSKDIEAVNWAMAKMQSLGFDNVYKEPVQVPIWQRGHAKASTSAPFTQNLMVTALGGSVASPQGGIEAQVVRFDDLAALKEADAASVQGKIVFIDAKTERHISGKGYGKTVPGRSQGAVTAAEKGAVAIIIRSVGTSSHRFAHTGIMRYKEGVAKIPAAAISAPDANLLNQILARGKGLSINLDIGPQHLGYATSYNVIAEVTGQALPDEIVLIGAHLDSWDEGTGALDDGAGVAIVSAAAKHIMDQARPKRTIRVVLFAAEEIGLVGAKAYVAAHKNEMDKHIVAAESDFGAGTIWAWQSRFPEALLPQIEPLKEELARLGVEYLNNKANGGPDVSIMPKEGVSVVSLNQDGQDYFDYHHTPDDTLDKIDRDKLKQNVVIWTTFTNFIANL